MDTQYTPYERGYYDDVLCVYKNMQGRPNSTEKTTQLLVSIVLYSADGDHYSQLFRFIIETAIVVYVDQYLDK